MPTNFRLHTYNWTFGDSGPSSITYDCAYCGTHTSSRSTLVANVTVQQSHTGKTGRIFFCPVCSQPTFVDQFGEQVPSPRLGAELNAIPEDGLKQLYNEARDCSSVGANTACVMLCRKILMNLAVREGAEAGKSFVQYVDYLVGNNFVPPKGRAWVDKIRQKGNEANHEIHQMADQDAKEIMHLVEMLLRFNFELGAPGGT